MADSALVGGAEDVVLRDAEELDDGEERGEELHGVEEADGVAQDDALCEQLDDVAEGDVVERGAERDGLDGAGPGGAELDGRLALVP